MPAQKKYDAETQARAVRMFTDRMAEGDVSQQSPSGPCASSRGATDR